MTITSTIALIFAVLIFALIPGPGVMSIIAQSVSRGFKSTALYCLGVVSGDLCYLLMAIFGMGFIAQKLGTGFLVLKWIGAAYLIYLGIKSWMAAPPVENGSSLPTEKGFGKTYLAGLCVSLGNPKLIAFYCGFLPGFMDLQTLTASDVIIVTCAVIPTVLAVLLSYAWLGDRSRTAIRSPKIWKIANRCAGSVLIGSGVAVAME
ncbi:LysE family translocator [Maridesulfovibrio salexigens]|uniref:Lysine exporter protein (LYSE/YGGA) n=1 Tax=Maridesulfovibrio salexigens (strain ATCC 14822 / DSM 2638 / NCIMB 8403 / VKM B-1763) TaxID=526222 RepID=C6C221_MARSD|nr:LysE family translocator [Maridesulfovibrio salexigens]ACS81222.1 Lysine exporter protein (LYSE/YGGA) [Maridesulfovibrio salexigens DSM 2638]